MRAFVGDKQSVAELVTTQQLYQLLGIRNLLTDDEMNISNALMSDTAKKAISNIKYSSGVNTFHYYGAGGYEGVNWLFQVSPNTNYRMVIVANSTSEITALDATQPYMPWGINSKEDLTDATSGDIANGHLPLPWSGRVSESIFFNSGRYNNLYLNTNFGLIKDEVVTDITLRIELFKADSIQDQIGSSFSTQDTQINTLGQTITNNLAEISGRVGKLEGTQTVDSPDFNTITATGVYYITNSTSANEKNSPSSHSGALVVSNGNGNRISQLFYPDDGTAPWYRILQGVNNPTWYQLSTQNDITNLQSDITNLQNQINQQNQTIQSLTTRFANHDLLYVENKAGGTSA